LIRPAGYYNIKADRLKQMTGFLFREYGGRIHRMRREKTGVLREKLLGVKGIGPETADSILLYALDKPSFVIDAYTRRVFSRHGIAGEGLDYDAWQDIFVKALPRRLGLYKDYHAQIVRVAKGHCRTQPRCRACPLKSFFEAAARKKNKIPRQ
nr:endonuclease III domain-containing protein [Candidatus Omnitrophota bacterium]